MEVFTTLLTQKIAGAWFEEEVQERTLEQSRDARNCTGRSGGAVLPRTYWVEPLSQVNVIGVSLQALAGTTKLLV